MNTDSSGCKGTDSHLGDSSTRARKLAPPAKTAIPSQPHARAIHNPAYVGHNTPFGTVWIARMNRAMTRGVGAIVSNQIETYQTGNGLRSANWDWCQ